jgi:mono/diheme cytochrome c family protein
MAAIVARAAIFTFAAAACTQGGAPPRADAGTEARGAQIFSGSCAACHQSDGHGIPNLYPGLAGSPVVMGDPAALARWVIRGERPASMPPGRYSSLMPQFGWLKDADTAALLTYIRSQFGNHARAVDADAVAGALGRR